jgi:hypothetical protein
MNRALTRNDVKLTVLLKVFVQLPNAPRGGVGREWGVGFVKLRIYYMPQKIVLHVALDGAMTKVVTISLSTSIGRTIPVPATLEQACPIVRLCTCALLILQGLDHHARVNVGRLRVGEGEGVRGSRLIGEEGDDNLHVCARTRRMRVSHRMTRRANYK